MQVIRREAPIFVIRAEPPIEEREPRRVIDQIAPLAVVQLVRVIVHEDVAEPADVERDVRVIRGLQQENQAVHDDRRRQIHTHQIRNDDERRLELPERRIRQRRLISTQEIQFRDGMVRRMLSGKTSGSSCRRGCDS